MAHNLYHLLHRLPAVVAWETPPALEALAQQLVQSGLLRIQADHYRNYVRHGTSDSDRTFTARQLTDPALTAATEQLLARLVPPAAGPAGIAELRAHLRRELKKARGVSPEHELRVARLVVQATHPAVLRLILQSGTEIFVSYAHTVGELLAVHQWQTLGFAGGLQATSEESTAVYISCGGDPFHGGADKTHVTDGFPALARMLVIGAQELGHYADLQRDAGGQIIGRHSLDPAVQAARRADLAHLAAVTRRVQQAGLAGLQRAEQAVAFYARRKLRFTPPWLFHQLRRLLHRWRFTRRLDRKLRFSTYPPLFHGEAYGLFLADMGFNLTPLADAYRRDDPAEEEAIACIEAVARVPQQVQKWGHAAVRLAWPSLYAVYYERIIPACIAASGWREPVARPARLQELLHFMRRRFGARPAYFPEPGQGVNF